MIIAAKIQSKSKIDNKLSKKRDRRTYSAQRYQEKKEWYRQQYLQKKEEREQQEKELENNLYQASNIKILMTLKEYSELNKEKRKIWLDFAWVLKDLNEKGIAQIEEVMKLEQFAGNIIRDYRETAINETRKGKSWNSLSEEEKSKLIKYWANEKVRKENEIKEKLTDWENQAKAYEKELELSKFHEERGKIKCPCWKCAESKKLSEKINKELFNDNGKIEEKQEKIKSECVSCYEFKQVDKESGLCEKCEKE